ncbi:MAG: hypothetical protein GXZ08_02405 [Tissierellia bacterium]|nr:hypothetical protein [Tissierellia bacterium]
MNDFYFVYGLERGLENVSRLCRHIDNTMEQWSFEDRKWYEAPYLYEVFIGEDAIYDEITEEEANKIIEYSK